MSKPNAKLRTTERRQGERRFWCRMFNAAQAFWDWIDSRQIDVHIVSAFILWGTYRLTTWAVAFSEAHAGKLAGADVALIIAAVVAPYAAVQAAAIGFVFSARRTSFAETKPDAQQ